MIDVDTPKDGSKPVPADEALDILYSVCPELRAAPHVLAASASSYVYHDDVELIGSRGLRVFVPVNDAQDIPRAGKVLFKKLWLAGHGHIELSKAGTMLERGLIDKHVWQPERLDFAGGAHCEPPLEQRRPEPEVFNDVNPPLDTMAALPDLTAEEEAEYRCLVDKAKTKMRSVAEETRAVWIEERVSERLTNNGQTEETHPDEARILREGYRLAVEHRVLYSDFVLHHENGQAVTVGNILDDPEKWHNQRFGDPLEPGCYGDDRIAWVNLRAAGRPYIYSHAHGGCRYTLHRARREIRIDPGERVRIVDQALELMRLDGGVFERGGEIVRVGGNGEIIPLTLAGVQFLLDRLARWMKYGKASSKWEPTDAPKTVAEGVLANRGHWDLPRLVAVVTAPSMELPSGRDINEEGLDEKSGLLLQVPGEKHWPAVPPNPSTVQVKDALDSLWHPFTAFPFCSALDRGVFLSAILTALVRPALDTSLAFSITSPTAGSGKSLLARCLSLLAGQSAPSVMAGASTDEEMRKRLLALGRSGSPVIVLDNLSGVFDSDALCAWLTSETFSDRLLGVSEQVTVPTRSLTLLTGNNLTLKGDLCRRVLTCRIDPGLEAPWRRGFDFNPAEHCRQHRIDMAIAGLTILRAGLQNGKVPADRLASFETWSDTVRRAVIFVQDQHLIDIDDPSKAIDAAYDDDPETGKLKALMSIWHVEFADEPTSVSRLMNGVLNTENSIRLNGVLDDIAGERGIVNPRKLGRWLKRNKDRICDGRRLEEAGKRDGVTVWRVRMVAS